MLHFLKGNRSAQLFLIGSLAFCIGLTLASILPLWGRLSFYVSILCLGYEASKEALVTSFQEKKVNVDLLMVLAALGAMVIGEEGEAVTLLLIFSGAEVLEAYVNAKSSASLTSLLKALPDQTKRLLDSGQLEEVEVKSIKAGELILVPKGEQFPLDGLVLQETSVSDMALTGESMPVYKGVGAEVFAGTVNLEKPVHVQVTKTSDQTVFSHIIRLVEEAQNQPSSLETRIEAFESYFVPTVLILVPLFMALLMALQGLDFSQAFYRGMVLLTVASPCALVASVTPATLSAISHAAKLGVLVKGGRVMTQLAEMEHLFTDKTGTLTQGEFQLVDYQVPDKLLALVIAMVQSSHHPISQAIANSLFQGQEDSVLGDLEVRELAGQGLEAGPYRLVKEDLVLNLADPKAYLTKIESNWTSVFLADDREILGYFALADQLRPEARRAVEGFQESGVSLEMLTGDREPVAKALAQDLGLLSYQANCLPADKAERISKMSSQVVVGMIGDGINDAPALAHAQVGIAMGAGTAIAMEVADLVMIQNHLGKLLDVYRLSQKLKKVIKQNILFAVGVMALLVVLNLMGVLDLTQGVVFHECSTILVILNGLRLLKPSPQTAP